MKNTSTKKLVKAALAALLVTAPFAGAASNVFAEEDFEIVTYFDETTEEPQEEYDWLNEYESLTDEEKKTLREAWDEIEKIYNEYESCYDEKGNVKDQKKLDELDKKEKEIWDSIADIDAKMTKEDIKKGKESAYDYVNNSKYLDKDEKKQYIEALDKYFDLYEKSMKYVDVQGNVTDEKKFNEIMDEIDKIHEITDKLDIKITEGEIDDSKDLTDDEKKTLKDAYAKLRDLYAKENEYYDEDGNVTDQKALDKIMEEEGKIITSIEDIEAKMYGWDVSEFETAN